MDCRQLLFVVCAVVLQLSGVECQKTCPDAPATAEDRRTDKSVVKIASYNMYWLFDGKSDPNPVPWTSWQSAYSHAKHMAKEIERINADIYVLVEVEDCSILDYVIDQMTDKTLYKRYLVQGTDSSTGQDVALLTKIDPITPLTRSKDYVNYPLPGMFVCRRCVFQRREGVFKKKKKKQDQNVLTRLQGPPEYQKTLQQQFVFLKTLK